VLDSNLDSHGIVQGCRNAEVEVISGARWLALRGPADHDKFLAVKAFDLEPQAAVAGRVGGIGAFRDDALELQLAGLLMEGRTLSAVVIAVMQGRRHTRQQRGKPRLALDQRPGADVVAVEMQKVENKKHQPGCVTGIRRGLDHAKGGDAVGEDAAQLAVEIGLARAERRHGRGDRRIFMGPVEAVRVSNRTSPRSRRACMR
jgi:hypothetical protein